MPELGIPVLDSDAVVRELYDIGGMAVTPIGGAFPGAVSNGRVDRAALAAELVKDASGFERLESIVHPLVRNVRDDFVHSRRTCENRGLLDIPLLFETGSEDAVDAIDCCVSTREGTGAACTWRALE